MHEWRGRSMNQPKLAMYRAAIRRKLGRLLGRGVTDYPPSPAGAALSPSLGYRAVAADLRPDNSFPKNGTGDDITQWQVGARRTLAALTGWKADRPPVSVTHRVPAVEISRQGIVREAVYLRVRAETDVPVHLLRPAGPEPKGGWPVAIILSGSTSGVHLAYGAVRVPVDHVLLGYGADLGVQAAERGYLAVCIEQIGYAERREQVLTSRSASPTIDAANHALLVGRTLMGDKAMDVSSVLDWLMDGADLSIDRNRIFLFGHSTGGTAALYCTALDTRIRGTLASGCVGWVRDTLMTRRATDGDGIVPGLLRHFEADDLVALSAPRPFVALSGDRDHIFPFEGTDSVVESARSAYRALENAAGLESVRVDGPHRYYPTPSWAAWRRVIDAFPEPGAWLRNR